MTDYTYNTGNPIGSTDVRDGVDNLKSFDVLLNSTDDTYQDRLGNTVPTAAGAIKALGPIPADFTFTTGGTFTSRNQAAKNPPDGNWYGWGGDVLPHDVAPGTDPTLPGSGYVPRTDVVLRSQLACVIYSASGVADASGLQAAATAASAAKKSLAINGVARCESLVTITCKLVDTADQLFTTDSNVRIGNGLPVRPEWFGSGDQSIALAVAALPVLGGVVELKNKTYASPYRGAFGASYLAKDNVKIVGAKRPDFEDDHSSLVAGSGSIIQGSFYVWANNFEIENVGIDAGPDVRAAIGLVSTQDGLVLAPPTHDTGTTKRGGSIKNCVSLGVLANDFGHNILFEGYTSGVMHDVDGRCAIHNLVVKSKNVVASKLRARGAISDNLIFKSDSYAVCEASSATDVILSEYPGNTPQFGAIFQAVTAGMSGCGLHNAQILSKATTGLRIESPSTFVNYGFQGSDITIDGSENGLYIFGLGAKTEHAGITNLTIKNATAGIVEQGSSSMHRVTGVTFVGVTTQLYTESDIQLHDVNVIANAPDSPKMLTYGNGTARPTIGSVVSRGLVTWDNIEAPVPVNGWSSVGGQPLDIFARDGKVNISGVLDVGTNGLAFTIDARLRTLRNLWLPLMSYPVGSSAFAVLQTDGQVIIETSGGSAKVSFDGVSYGVGY